MRSGIAGGRAGGGGWGGIVLAQLGTTIAEPNLHDMCMTGLFCMHWCILMHCVK